MSRKHPLHAAQSWKRLLLLPTAIRLSAGASRDHLIGWNTYWRGVRTTGDTGDVLWDTDDPAEMDAYRRELVRHLDPALPILDAGCGNGRQTRALAELFPRVMGVDLSSEAVQRARNESAGLDNVEFATADLTAADTGQRVFDQLGTANVFVRGVFHVLSPDQRRSAAENLHTVVGGSGRIFLAETNFPGDVLGYLRYLGASPRGIPRPLAKAIREIPKPRHFGERELRDSFPSSHWRILASGQTPISVVPMGGTGNPSTVPGFYGVIAPASAS